MSGKRSNQRWPLDFTEDGLANCVKFRTCNLKDNGTCECPDIDVALSILGTRVVEMLERVARERGYPDVLVVDNGPELRGRPWMVGRRIMALNCTSSIPASRRRTPTSRALTAACAKNA